MSRALRPRSSRPSYSFALDISDEENAGPSNTMVIDQDADSGSEFEAEKVDPIEDDPTADSDEDEEDDFMDDAESLAPSDRPVKPLPKSKGKGKAKVLKPETQRAFAPRAGPSLPRGSTSKMYSLPTVSIHHRHRAVPLYFPIKRIDRLTHPAKLFEPARTMPTNNLTFNPTVQDRVHKGLGFNVGPGPLWELLEDRAWYKEAIDVAAEEIATEAKCRPRVHNGIAMNHGWDIVDQQYVVSMLQLHQSPNMSLAAQDCILFLAFRPRPCG